MSKYVSLKDFDWVLLALLVVISALGVVQIYSTTVHTKFAGAYLKQILWILLGVGLLFILCLYDYHDLLNHMPFLYFTTLLLLVAVLLVGGDVSGAKRWIRLGGVGFQVSEPVKLVMILLLARFFSDSPRDGVSFPDTVKVFLTVGVPCALIALQPDLGTAMTIVPIALVMLYLAGLKPVYFALMVLAALLAFPLAWHHMKPYQRARLTTFLNPEVDARRSGYQLLQSKIAVGSGQLWGKGTAQGTQTQLWFLPVPHTDFIYAAFSEEHGFVGAVLGLLLYLMVLLRLLHNARAAPDPTGTYIVVGVATILFVQILVNVGMVVGYVPVTGIPLPLMSYGGTSILFTFMSMGLVNSVRVRRFVN
jgi:rod shape determining protein RodA